MIKINPKLLFIQMAGVQPGMMVYDAMSSSAFVLQSLVSTGAELAVQLKDPLPLRVSHLWKVDWQVDELAKQAPAPWMSNDAPSHESEAFAHAFMSVGYDDRIPSRDGTFRYETAGTTLGREETLWEKDVSDVIVSLKSENKEARLEAVCNLGFRIKDEGARKKVIAALNDSHPYVRAVMVHIVQTLTIGGKNEELLALLNERKSDNHPYVRVVAGLALGPHLPEENKKILERAANDLVEALGDRDNIIRIAAADLIGFHGFESEEVQPVLVEMLKDKDPEVRLSAVRALKYV